MNKSWTIPVLMLFAFGVVLGFLFNYTPKAKTINNIRYDTVKYVDTVTFRKLVPYDSAVISYKQIKVPVDCLHITDTTIINQIYKDSFSISVPISQKLYKDTSYQAWVSGYEANLDSIKVFPTKTIVTKTITPVIKKKRWGLGVQAGYGITNTGKTVPYIGVGISYNIFNW